MASQLVQTMEELIEELAVVMNERALQVAAPALLLLYCCFTAALLLLYCCYLCTAVVMNERALQVDSALYYCLTAALLLVVMMLL